MLRSSKRLSVILFITSVFGVLSPLILHSQPPVPNRWELKWNDEFDNVTKLDKNWIFQNRPSSHISSSRESWDVNLRIYAKLTQHDTALMPFVDVLVYHRVGSNSTRIRKESPIKGSDTFGRPVYHNEFEYQSYSNHSFCINTAQNIMNWFTFANSPTWFWLHALKLTYNFEASGYSLGFLRLEGDNDYT